MKHWPFESLVFEEKSPEEMASAAEHFYDEIRLRRTVRDFSEKPVPRELIENALRAAGTAPSGANMQPWHFVVVGNPDLKRKIREAAEHEEREFYEHRASEEWLKALEPLGTNDEKPFLERAPWLIAVFLKKFSYDSDGNRLKNYYTAESVGIACGFLLTALHQAGLVTLTHTPSPMKFLNQLLDRPKTERPYMLIVTGFPEADAKVPVIGKEPLEKIATFME
ncbi:MAG TPA: nitroreductase family protein [Xanthomonadales bacterium]|nr:nitroreductase family protein [Xanthomonadales bacterium]